MDVRVADQQCRARIPSPRARAARQEFQGQDQGERPDLAHDNDHHAVVPLLRHPRPPEQLDQEEHIGRDREQVRLEGIETELLEVEGEVRRDRGRGDRPGQAEDVERPHVVVAEGLPQQARREALPVVHAALGRVVTQDAVDHDLLLALGEPSVLAAEVPFRLRRGRGQVKPGEDADDAGQPTLEGEQPPPAGPAGVLTQVQDAVGQERRDDLSADEGAPEEGQADGQFFARVEEAEVEHDVRDEAALEEAQEAARGVERLDTGQAALADGDDGPE